MLKKLFKFVVYGFVAIIGLIILVAIFSDEKQSTVSKVGDPTPQPSTSEQKVAPSLKVGDTFRTDKFEIQVTQATTRQSVGDSMFSSKPSDGAVYVAVTFSYKNISQKPISSFSTPEIKLQAPDGTTYDPDVGASSSFATELNLDEKILSNLNPGIKVKGADVFEVSRELFDQNTWKVLVKADADVGISFK